MHPLTVVLTLYVPVVDTIIDAVVSPVLHNNEPAEPVVRVDVLLQLLTTVITGVAGVDVGAATTLLWLLLHPFTVELTVYVAAAVTDIEDVVALPGAHNNEPVDEVDTVSVPSQLLTTIITGIGGAVLGDATTVDTGLIHPFAVCWVAEYVPATLTGIMPKCDPPGVHVIVPEAPDAVNVDVALQLSTPLRLRAGGIVNGTAVPMLVGLVQPLTVRVRLYVLAIDVLIEVVVSPELHNKTPAETLDNIEFPHLLITDITGVEGIAFGAALPVPATLTHPLTPVWVTWYVPAAVTVMEVVVSDVLQSKVPVAVVDKVELAQLSKSVTTGAAGTINGVAALIPGALGHPLAVVVTLYVPDAVTVIEEVVAPVFHNKVPVATVDNIEFPQLSASFTTGVEGAVFGAEVPVLTALIHPFTVRVRLYVAATDTLIEVVVAPVLQSREPAEDVDNVEVPLQLSKSATTGAEGVDFGPAKPVLVLLIHPFTVRLTL